MRHFIASVPDVPSVPKAKEVPPIILQRPYPTLNNLEDPKTTIAALIAQVEQLKAENRSLKQKLVDLSAATIPAMLPPDLIRSEVVFGRNRRGHYIRDRFWQVKEDHPMVKSSLALLKWTGLGVFGFVLALLAAASFEQAALVTAMIAIATFSWKPIVVIALSAMAIAALTEAV